MVWNMKELHLEQKLYSEHEFDIRVRRLEQKILIFTIFIRHESSILKQKFDVERQFHLKQKLCSKRELDLEQETRISFQRFCFEQ